jgi:hypothetical protein
MDVALELIDHATGRVFARSEVPLESLPERFAGMDTTLSVGGDDWQVLSADPDTRAAIASAGCVQLVLHKVSKVDPRALHFTLPTLENTQPEQGAAPGDEVSIRLHEDDWRQVEFVHGSQRALVEEELADIARILSEHRQGAAFDAVHVRQRVPEPLRGVRLRVAEVERAIGREARPWALRGGGVVKDGFAVPDAEAVVYGTARDGWVETLCVYGMLPDVVGKLHALARDHGLMLVDWCAGQCLHAHEAGFVA